MPMQLDDINFGLRRELELVHNKLAIALHGLNIIFENGDIMHVAKKTLEEIDTM